MSEPLTAEGLMEIVSDSLAATTEGTDWAEAPEPSDEPGSPYVKRLTNEVVLATLDAARPSGEVDVERLTAAIQSDAVREFRFEDHTFPFSKAMAKIIAREYAALDGRREEG